MSWRSVGQEAECEELRGATGSVIIRELGGQHANSHQTWPFVPSDCFGKGARVWGCAVSFGPDTK